MLRQDQSGEGGAGGTIVPANRISVRRSAAIGDTIAASVVADKLQEQGYEVSWQCHNLIHCVMRKHPTIVEVTNPNHHTHVDLDNAYERDNNRRLKFFHQIFNDKANEQLTRIGINLGPAINCRPRLLVNQYERQSSLNRFQAFPRPWVFICPRSDSYAVRRVPDGIWKEAGDKIEGTKFWLGRHPAPVGFIDLKGKLEDIVAWLSVADLLVTVDTGPMHIAAAFGIPIVAINQASSPEFHLNDQNDFITIEPPGLHCLNCCKHICPINSDIPPCQHMPPESIAEAVNRKLKYFTQDGVSAVVPIYKPELAILNRCLDCLVGQVDEIIVTMEGNSILPDGHRTHPKIRYVKTWQKGIGYGRNTNFGVRHSSNRWLMLLNDDVFLKPHTIEELRKHAVNGTGLVAHQLRFADGTIYPVVMKRYPGDRDWRHIDHRKFESSIKQVEEVDTCCGASILVSRKAFYDVGGFDEGYFLYCEDNDFILRVRKAGYKAVFDPNICATHLNGESSKKLGIPQNEMIARSGKRFHEHWDKYIFHNINRPIGTFDY